MSNVQCPEERMRLAARGRSLMARVTAALHQLLGAAIDRSAGLEKMTGSNAPGVTPP